MANSAPHKESKTLPILVFLLVGFGLLMLSSAGAVEGQKKFGFGQYYLIRQLLTGVLWGALLYLLFSKIPYQFWKKMALPFLLLSLLAMLAIFIPPLGLTVRGAKRWLDVGLFTFQPAEVLKLALVIYFAAWFSGRSRRDKSWSYSLTPFLVVFGFVGLLLVMQPDIGTLGIITIIILTMFFLAGGGSSFFLKLITGIAVLAVPVAVFSSYRTERILAFLNRSGDPQGISYHINQALIAIGRGGWWGVGFGQSAQKNGFLPEPVGDSIFAVLMEELGIAGGAALIGLFLVLIFYLVQMARSSADRFAQLVILGITVWIASQTFINMAAISGLIPLTGVPLPFISYGGTSLAVLLGGLGIIANIAKHKSKTTA